jgi:hypothetical protein
MDKPRLCLIRTEKPENRVFLTEVPARPVFREWSRKCRPERHSQSASRSQLGVCVLPSISLEIRSKVVEWVGRLE